MSTPGSSTLLSENRWTTTRLLRLPAAKAGGVASPPASGHSAHHPLRPRLGVAKDYHSGSRSVAAAEGMAVELRARLLRLRHPNIVTVREVSSHASSRRGAVSSVRVVSDYVDDAGTFTTCCTHACRHRGFSLRAHLLHFRTDVPRPQVPPRQRRVPRRAAPAKRSLRGLVLHRW